MLHEFCVITEGFATCLTLTGLFTSVDFLMLPKLGAAPEAFPTLITLIWLLSLVDSLMLS